MSRIPTLTSAMFMSALLLLSAAACSDDDENGTTADAAVKTDTGVKPDTGAADKGDVDNGLEDSFVPSIYIDGAVVDAATQAGLVGETVTVVGSSPAVTATTKAKGLFSIKVNKGATVLLEVKKTGHLSLRRGAVIPAKGVKDFIMPLISTTLADTMATGAGLPKGDTTKGGVTVEFLNHSKKGGEGATLSATNAGAFTLTSTFQPKKSTTLIAGGVNTLNFVNVATGDTTVTLKAPTGTTCTLDFPTLKHKVVAGAITYVASTCK